MDACKNWWGSQGARFIRGEGYPWELRGGGGLCKI